MKAAALLIAVLALSGCATATHSSSPLRIDGLAGIGQSTRVGPFVVTPRAVVEDNRCPINARCIWAGRLRLQADVAMNGGSVELRTVLTLGELQALPKGKILLVSAAPGRLAGTPPSPPASLFGFEAR